MPKRRTSSAASSAISATCSALGSRLTCVSQMKSWRPGSISICIAASVRGAVAQADHVAHVAQVVGVAAERAAQHGVGLALAHQHRRRAACCGCASPSAPARATRRRARMSCSRRRPRRRTTAGSSGFDALAVLARRQPQAELARCARPITSGRPEQQRPRQSFVDDHLRRAQHALVLAFGVDDALGASLGRREHRLHRAARLVDELAQPLRGSARMSAIGRVATPLSIAALRHRRRDHLDQARIEGLRNQVVAAEAQADRRRRPARPPRGSRRAPARRSRAPRPASSPR